MKTDNIQGIIFKQKAPIRTIGPVIRLRRNIQGLMHLGKPKHTNPVAFLNHEQTADILHRLRTK